MIVRSEFSFREVFGPIAEVVACLPVWGGAIADWGTWGHVNFTKACKAANKHAVLGRRVMVQGNRWAVLLPRSSAGLRALYGLPTGPVAGTQIAQEDWYGLFPGIPGPEYGPRAVAAFVPGVARLGARTGGGGERPVAGQPLANSVAFSDNFYPRPGDREAWEAMLGRAAPRRPGPMHILTGDELLLEGATPEQLTHLRAIIEDCDTPLPMAENIRFPVQDAQAELVAQATAELNRRGLNKAPYAERLVYELTLIAEKKFADYFLVIADMMRYAKQHMLVGPARGSSCGSLVCWMMRITEVDPIQHKLLFERFIDFNRSDLPDIDIDFADEERHLVIEYLGEKYGVANVAQIGTVMRYKPKSALTDVAKSTNVPMWELDKLKDVVIERSSGDARYSNQLSDSLENLEVGKALVLKYPTLKLAGRIEGHARSAGTHAAGIIVCNRPVTNYCTVVDGGAQVDKKMAEAINMLKIDALGLRTLSVIDECCRLTGKDRNALYDMPLDDQAVFDLLNAHKYSSVFQFEGSSLRSVGRQINVDCFEDIAAITALARPGPLSGGETARWIHGKASGTCNPLHPALEPYTRDTYGTIVYQEDVMRVVREMGGFSWADTSKIRKVMSDRAGTEAFQRWGDQFLVGARANGIAEQDAARIWKAIDTMGCLAGDTVLENPFPNHATPKSITIAELAANRGYIRPRAEGWDVVKRQQLYSMEIGSGKIKPQRCLDAFYSGHKMTALLTLENGAEIRATLNHKFFRAEGTWTEMQSLQPGDMIAVTGITRPTARHTKTGTGSGGHNWWSKLKAGEPLYKRQVIALRKRFKRCQRCKKAPYEETHHKNGDHSDHATSNLLPVCRVCHKALHGAAPVPHSVGKTVAFSTVKSIGKLKMVDVYDVSMPAPGHNFLANGIVAHNSWCFNKSHAVAYGIVSYWTAWFKAHHPVEFAVANLRHAKDEDSAKRTLRELMREGGIEFLPVDRETSTDRWEYREGYLIGPLTGLPGLGAKTAREILARRANGLELTPRHKKLLAGESKFADYAPTRKRWGHLYDEPTKHFKTVNEVAEIETLTEHEGKGRFCIIGRLIKKNLRDLNEEKWLVKRNGKRVPEELSAALFFNLEDDTGQIICRVGPDKYQALGKRIVEEGKIGDWFAVVGELPDWTFKILFTENVRWLKEA